MVNFGSESAHTVRLSIVQSGVDVAVAQPLLPGPQAGGVHAGVFHAGTVCFTVCLSISPDFDGYRTHFWCPGHSSVSSPSPQEFLLSICSEFFFCFQHFMLSGFRPKRHQEALAVY